jgi:hypothetical protein
MNHHGMGFLVVVCMAFVATSALEMEGVWGDGMVLSHELPMVHGSTSTSDTLTMEISRDGTPTQSFVVKADAEGHFTFSLPTVSQISTKSATLQVTSRASGGTVTATRVLFGFVFLCAGQR